jgi:hypothetical protein
MKKYKHVLKDFELEKNKKNVAKFKMDAKTFFLSFKIGKFIFLQIFIWIIKIWLTVHLS